METEISICIPVLLIFFLPFLLLLLGIIPNKIAPSRRFTFSAICIIAIWCFVSILIILQNASQFTLWQWFAGMLFITGVLIFAFMLWSIFCWGYTLFMLLCLAEHNRVSSIQMWQNLYTRRSDGIRRLTVNRTQVLVWIRCVSISGEKITLTPLGHLIANFFETISTYLGLRR